MLDVHAPHEPTHTWTDFFLHIATIAVGLLLAVALEQSVEWIHHRHQVREVRAALAEERAQNREDLAADAAYIPRKVAVLRNDLLVLNYLRDHPGTPEEKLPGVLLWGNFAASMQTSAWEIAQQTGVSAYMTRDEVATNGMLYQTILAVRAAEADVWKATARAQSYAFVDPDPSHLTPDEITSEIQLVRDAMEAEYRYAVLLQNFSAAFPDFTGAPTNQYINSMTTTPERAANPGRLTTPRALSLARIPGTEPNVPSSPHQP